MLLPSLAGKAKEKGKGENFQKAFGIRPPLRETKKKRKEGGRTDFRQTFSEPKRKKKEGKRDSVPSATSRREGGERSVCPIFLKGRRRGNSKAFWIFLRLPDKRERAKHPHCD